MKGGQGDQAARSPQAQPAPDGSTRRADDPMVGRYATLGLQKSLKPRNTLYTLASEPSPSVVGTATHTGLKHS